MINLTATTGNNPQTIAVWKVTSGSYWWQLKCVAWISQNTSNLTTTIYYKWQVEQWNYYPYWLDSHVYTLSLAGQSSSVSFSLPQSTSNGTRDMCSAQTLGTFGHNSTTGAFSGTFRFQGAYTWSTFDYSEAMTLPTIAIPKPPTPKPPTPEPPTPKPPTPEPPTPEPTPEPEPDPPTPIEFDNDPRYYIYADNELIYAAGVDGYEVLNPKLSLEVNKAGSLKFDVPVTSKMYNSINKLKTTVEARQGNEVLFRGRLLNAKRSINNTRSLYCEGFLSWMVDISFQPYTFNGQARDLLKKLISRYNSRASENRQVTYKYSDISSKVTVERKDYSTAWKEAKDILIDGVGGYIVPYLTSEETGIQWLSTYGSSTSQVIQFGENLLDFEEYIDASEVFTAVRPFGKEVSGSRIHLSGDRFVVNDTAVNMFGRIERTVFFDEITTESALREAAEAYLRVGLQAAISITIKAVDLHLLDVDAERIRLGDSVRVISVPHEIDAYFLCTKIEIDIAHPQNTVYTFGATQRTISELTNPTYNRYIITEGA